MEISVAIGSWLVRLTIRLRGTDRSTTVRSDVIPVKTDGIEMTTRLVTPTALATVVLLAACGTAETDWTVYGDELTLSDTTLVSSILANPTDYVGERVLVAGTVVEVCEMRGCWLELGSDKEFERMRVKVEDGVIVFPMSARGHRAVVEGIVEEVALTLEQAIEQAKHHAEEHGLEFDPASVTGPTTYYQLRGIGAVIDN
jgi:hypothetical protein